jgi:hypothetical protein
MRTVLKTAGFYLVFAIVIPFLLLEGAFRLLPVAAPPYLQVVAGEIEKSAPFLPGVRNRLPVSL